MKEIRWHGRGGQGAKTVSQLLAAAMLQSGYRVQAFPEYGPERSGAPIQAYTRISERPIRLHCGVTTPDVVVVLDESLMEEIEVTAGLKEDGLLLVNTTSTGEEVEERTGFSGTTTAIDADALAAQAGGTYGNVVMVGALAAAQGEPTLGQLLGVLEEAFHGKLSEKVLLANSRAVEAGYRYVEANGYAAMKRGEKWTVS